MDILCVREATKFAADHCRAGKVSSDWASAYNEQGSVLDLHGAGFEFALRERHEE